MLTTDDLDTMRRLLNRLRTYRGFKQARIAVPATFPIYSEEADLLVPVIERILLQTNQNQEPK